LTGLRRVEIEGKPVIELGYVLLSEFWGQGFATEMATASVEVAFEHMGLNELVSYMAISNKASQRVMEKAGFGFKFKRNFTYSGETHVLYKLTLRDYLLIKR
jgi:ribosomal-protein-alanine N-acetyltransferase